MTARPTITRRFAVDVLPAILYMAAIVYGGSIPLKAPPIDVGLSTDKVLHLLAFGGLQVLLLRALRHEFPRLGFARKNWLAAAASSALGLLLELYQSFLPHRSAELWDWIADTIGAGLAAALVLAGGRRFLEAPGEAPPAVEPR